MTTFQTQNIYLCAKREKSLPSTTDSMMECYCNTSSQHTAREWWSAKNSPGINAWCHSATCDLSLYSWVDVKVINSSWFPSKIQPFWGPPHKFGSVDHIRCAAAQPLVVHAYCWPMKIGRGGGAGAWNVAKTEPGTRHFSVGWCTEQVRTSSKKTKQSDAR